MIRALRKKGLTFKSIAELCGCSSGSVAAEVKAMRLEEAEALKKKMDEEVQIQNSTFELSLVTEVVPQNLDTAPILKHLEIVGLKDPQ